MKQVADQTIQEVDNASSKVKLKWGGSEARNRRRLPASDDVATLVQHVSSCIFHSIRSILVVTSVARMGVWESTHFLLFAACLTFKTFLSRGRKSTRAPPNANLPMIVHVLHAQFFIDIPQA
jgi:hypothetical protein